MKPRLRARIIDGDVWVSHDDLDRFLEQRAIEPIDAAEKEIKEKSVGPTQAENYRVQARVARERILRVRTMVQSAIDRAVTEHESPAIKQDLVDLRKELTDGA